MAFGFDLDLIARFEHTVFGSSTRACEGATKVVSCLRRTVLMEARSSVLHAFATFRNLRRVRDMDKFRSVLRAVVRR